MEVGFIGLGQMGRAMARNLLKAGHRVFVFNRTRSRAEELRDEGAEVADSPAGACKGDIVITILADDKRWRRSFSAVEASSRRCVKTPSTCQ